MELDAVDGMLFVAQTHDLVFGGPGGDFQTIRQGLAFDDEGVVAGGLERAGESGEDAAVVVEDRRGFAVHEAIGTDNIAAVNLTNRLMAEADTEDGSGRTEFADEFEGNACFVRGAGAG